MDAARAGIRQFRAELARYIGSGTPVAVTKHGQTVGYFIPTKAPAEADIAALQKAGKALDQLLLAKGVDMETIIAEFKEARKQGRSSIKKATSQAA